MAATRRVREDVWTLGQALCVERLKRGQHGGVQRHSVRSTTLRARDPGDAVQKIDVLPPQVEQVAPSESRVHGKDDFLSEERRRLDLFGRLDESGVLVFREISQP